MNNTKWLDPTKTLCYEDIGPDDVLIVKKKLFFTDERLNRNDNVQINLIYNQIKETIIDGTNPCTFEEAVLLAAIQCQIQYGDCDANKIKSNIIKYIYFKTIYILYNLISYHIILFITILLI